MHVDAAYAGAAFLCPEMRHYTRGLEVCYVINWVRRHFLLDIVTLSMRDNGRPDAIPGRFVAHIYTYTAAAWLMLSVSQ